MTVTRVVWGRQDEPGHEHASLVEDASGIVLRGVAVLGWRSQPCRLDYEVRCDPAWVTRSARVTGTIGTREIDARVECASGEWTLDGQPVGAVRGAVDVDLNFSPSTNLLPIRRLALPIGGRATVRAAWLRFPSFALEPLEQVYARLGERRYRYESNGGAFTAEIEVDASGLPSRYGPWVAEARVPEEG
jgi:uncharacterized protein